jgi:hypothetical protein
MSPFGQGFKKLREKWRREKTGWFYVTCALGLYPPLALVFTRPVDSLVSTLGLPPEPLELPLGLFPLPCNS